MNETEKQVPERFLIEARNIVFQKFNSVQRILDYPLERAFAWPPDELVKQMAIRLAAEAEVQRLRLVMYQVNEDLLCDDIYVRERAMRTLTKALKEQP